MKSIIPAFAAPPIQVSFRSLNFLHYIAVIVYVRGQRYIYFFYIRLLIAKTPMPVDVEIREVLIRFFWYVNVCKWNFFFNFFFKFYLSRQ